MEQFKLTNTPASPGHAPKFEKDSLLDMTNLTKAEKLDRIYNRPCGETLSKMLRHGNQIDELSGTIDILKAINKHPVLKKGYRVEIV